MKASSKSELTFSSSYITLFFYKGKRWLVKGKRYFKYISPVYLTSFRPIFYFLFTTSYSVLAT